MIRGFLTALFALVCSSSTAFAMASNTACENCPLRHGGAGHALMAGSAAIGAAALGVLVVALVAVALMRRARAAIG